MGFIDVRPALIHERRTIENLLQLYTHDFSETWAETERGDVDEQGRFAPYPLDVYWQDRSHTPLLIRSSGRIAGFALLNDKGHTGALVSRNIAEYFILRKYRRRGVGASAAHLMFAQWPGTWEAAVARKNLPALHFWKSAISGCSTLLGMSETDVRSADWDGPVLRFEVGRR